MLFRIAGSMSLVSFGFGLEMFKAVRRLMSGGTRRRAARVA